LTTLLKLIRWPNLLVVALTQVLLGRLLYARLPARKLSQTDFWLLILVTVMITAGGYIINDIYDRKIDAVNRPDRVIVGRLMPKNRAITWYVVFFLAGLLPAAYLAFVIHDVAQLSIYPAAVLLLWLYAYRLKKSLLWGNVVVALFCAFVPGILLYAERDELLKISDPASYRLLITLFAVYGVMAFVLTFWRELIKDLEDLKGDRAAGANTFPARFGVHTSRRIALAIGLLLTAAAGYYSIRLIAQGHRLLPAAAALFGLATAYMSGKISRARTPADFRRISHWIKGMMVAGILYLLLL